METKFDFTEENYVYTSRSVEVLLLHITGVAGPKRGVFGVGDNYVKMVATLALTTLAFEPWSRVVLLSLSGSKRPTGC